MTAALQAAWLVLWPFLKKFAAPILTYMKGRKEGQQNTENRASKRTTSDVEKANQAANDAVDRVNSGKLRDSDFRD